MTRRRAEPRCLAFALAAVAMAAHAQQGDAPGQTGGGLSVQPRVSLMQTWTDNLGLDDQNKDAALITTLSPGIRVSSNTARLRGSLDYSLHGIAYLKSDQASHVQNALMANLQSELVERMLFVDLRANIGQQNLSAFGRQSAPTLGSQGAVSNLVNENQRETSSLIVSPSLRGQLAGVATYELRGDFTRTETRGSDIGDSRATGALLRINQAQAGLLSWWLQANAQRTRSAASAATSATNRNESLRLGLNYRPDPDWAFSANVGQERSDYLGNGTNNGATAGVTADWTPTPRTRVGANYQHHEFGDSHGLTFEHRMARSVWRLSDTRTVTLGNTGALGGVRSNYDQFFLLFASLEPDPVKRDALVRGYLQSQGLSPDAPAAGGFLSTGPSQLRNQMLSFTLQGVRSTFSAQVGRSITSRLGSNVNQGDLANTSRIEQRSYSLSASHQLTPMSGISLVASRQETTGDLGSQSARLSSLVANWNGRLGPWLSVQLGGRHTRFEGVTPYTENAIYANLTQQF